MQISASTDKAKTIRSAITSSSNLKWDVNSFLLYCNYKDTGFLPDVCTLDNYRDVLMEMCTYIPLEEKYHYKPQLFALDYYGSSNMDFVVLYFSGLYSATEFATDKIRVMPPEHLRYLSEIITLHEQDIKENRVSPVRYADLTLHDITL